MHHPRSSVWPKGLPATIRIPQCSLNHFLDTAALRYPDKPAIIYCDQILTYAQLHQSVERLASYLVHEHKVKKADRILLLSQNCPQFTIAYYAILRARAVVVPVNAMTTQPELAHYINDSGAKIAIIAQEYMDSLSSYLDQKEGLQAALVYSYQEALHPEHYPADTPDWVLAAKKTRSHPRFIDFHPILAQPQPTLSTQPEPDDLCVFPYTSGTTGQPKACMHTHRTVLASLISSSQWRGLTPDSVMLSVAPMFHMLGMQAALNQPIMMGSTVVMMPRWNKVMAARLIQQYQVSIWAAPPAMIIDFFSQDHIDDYDLSSLALLSGGGAAMPESVSKLLNERYKINFNEAYGLSETASFLHSNPLHKPKRRCLGLATANVDSRVIDPDSGTELPQGEVGELVTHAPQVMLGYWNNEQANQEAFITIDGKRFLRTGDLVSMDEEGYFFMHERLKRMINASGFKVWPAEVENMLYEHPAILEACIIGVPDAKRGETVKAVVSLKDKKNTNLNSETLIQWCRDRMAAYKAPQYVSFVDELPKSSTGKILWRELEEHYKPMYSS